MRLETATSLIFSSRRSYRVSALLAVVAVILLRRQPFTNELEHFYLRIENDCTLIMSRAWKRCFCRISDEQDYSATNAASSFDLCPLPHLIVPRLRFVWWTV